MTTIISVAPDTSIPTIEAALAKLANLHDCNQVEFPAVIVVHQGTYKLTKPLDITTTYPLVIMGAENEKVVIEGGQELKDWTQTTVNGRKAWTAKAPCPVKQLYFRGKMLKRAAFPKTGFYRAQNDRQPWSGLFSGSNHFIAEPGSFSPALTDPEGIEIQMIHKWIEEYLPVTRYDAATGEIYSSHRSTFLIAKGDTEYRLENVREALLEPGEFYYDRKNCTVTVILEEDLDTCPERPVVSALGALVRLRHARFLTLKNLTFQYAGGYRPTCTRHYDMEGGEFINHAMQEGWLDEHSEYPFGAAPQAAVQVPGTIFMHHSHDCVIKNCVIANSGWYGIEVSAGCSNIVIDHNELRDLGAGGVRIGGSSFGGLVDEQTSRVTVINNHIHDNGLVYMSGVGVLITHAFGNLVEHNHIHDMFYSGVSAGWNWGFGETIARENRIGWNDIHDLGKGILSDMGGVYLLGIQPGTRVYNNYIANVSRRYYGGWGIYTDEGSSHVVVENNICTDCSSEAYHQHFGRENTLRFNIFAFGNDAILALSRGNEHNGVFPGENFSNALASYGNVFVSKGRPFIRSGNEAHLTIPTYMSENSIFYNTEGAFPPIGVAGAWSCNLEEWKARGFDRGALCENPGFKDLANRDFSFAPDSLLGRLNFPMLDRSQVGIQAER